VYVYDFKGQLVARNQPTPFFDRVNLHILRDQVLQIKQATPVAPATIDSVPCLGYQTSFVMLRTEIPKTPGGTPQITSVNQPVTIWLSTKDGLPKQITFGAPAPLTLIFKEFNEDYVINPP
jgi:hypothetical protein